VASLVIKSIKIARLERRKDLTVREWTNGRHLADYRVRGCDYVDIEDEEAEEEENWGGVGTQRKFERSLWEC
jgi:hypothetical protein